MNKDLFKDSFQRKAFKNNKGKELGFYFIKVQGFIEKDLLDPLKCIHEDLKFLVFEGIEMEFIFYFLESKQQSSSLEFKDKYLYIVSIILLAEKGLDLNLNKINGNFKYEIKTEIDCPQPFVLESQLRLRFLFCSDSLLDSAKLYVDKTGTEEFTTDNAHDFMNFTYSSCQAPKYLKEGFEEFDRDLLSRDSAMFDKIQNRIRDFIDENIEQTYPVSSQNKGGKRRCVNLEGHFYDDIFCKIFEKGGFCKEDFPIERVVLSGYRTLQPFSLEFAYLSYLAKKENVLYGVSFNKNAELTVYSVEIF